MALDDIRNVEANKKFRMRGVDYKPGDPVDVSELADHKISQMLNQRMLRPKKPAAEPADDKQVSG